MTNEELTAMLKIAAKLGWMKKPAEMVMNTIKYMIICKRCDELTSVGDCDGEYETLLSMVYLTKEALLDLKHEARELEYYSSLYEYEDIELPF